MFERVTDKDFCGCVMGTFASTTVDSHGHRFTKEVLEDWIELIEKDSQRRVMHLNHNEDDKIGEILDVELVEYDGIIQIQGKSGIYVGQEEILEKIDSGELQGFSVSTEDYVNTTKQEWEELEPNIIVSTLGEEFESVDAIFRETETKYRIELQKSIESLAIISAAASAVAIAREIRNLWIWYQSLDEETKENTEITINIENHYNFENMSEKDIERMIEEELDK